MPRIKLAKIHPPTSIEIPDRKKGALILLPGIPKKVSVDEVAFIKENFPALSFAEMPTKIQRRRKIKRTTASTSSFNSSISPAAKSDDGKSDANDDDGKRKKKRGK